MKKLTLLIHPAWALIAAGAWWLGSRQTENTRSVAREESRSRLAAGSHHAADNARTEEQRGRVAGDSAPEAVAWLRRFASVDGTISAENMTGAVMDALRDPDPVKGLRHFTHLLECLTPENAPAALAALKAHSGPRDTNQWMTLLCTAWGAKDGAAALAGTTARDDREAAMAGWARTDPAAAEQWLAALPPGTDDGDRKALQRSLVRGMTRQNPQGALAYITEQDGGVRGDLIKAMTKEQFADGAPATARWAAGLPDELRGTALETVARHYMQVDPAAGAAWAAESALAPDMRQAVGRVADRMAEKDVMAALKWTEQLPAGPGREEAFQQVFSEWARKDPTTSSQELLRMPAGAHRDNAIHSFAGSLVRENPEDAITWAAAISDPALRLDTQINVARKWNNAAPAAAQSWIAANLPADAQRRALGK
jgi:hypothetical protein